MSTDSFQPLCRHHRPPQPSWLPSPRTIATPATGRLVRRLRRHKITPFYHNLCTKGAPAPTEARDLHIILKRTYHSALSLLERKRRNMVDSADLKSIAFAREERESLLI